MAARPPWEVITETENKMRHQAKMTRQGRRDRWIDRLVTAFVVLVVAAVILNLILALQD